MNRLVQATPAVAPRTAEDPRRIGGYRVLGRLGVGGMGTVFLAADHPGVKVAVKVVAAPSWAANPSYRARFSREVRALKRVSVRTPSGWSNSTPRRRPNGSQMEYVPGPTLFRRWRPKAPAPDEVGLLALAMLRSLEALHRAGIIHRDLKPGT